MRQTEVAAFTRSMPLITPDSRPEPRYTVDETITGNDTQLRKGQDRLRTKKQFYRRTNYIL
jgi:hypothetical protein